MTSIPVLCASLVWLFATMLMTSPDRVECQTQTFHNVQQLRHMVRLFRGVRNLIGNRLQSTVIRFSGMTGNVDDAVGDTE
ncbi:hypothetical protein BaRGS_00037538 [Batillaria attramentaria]|uniref:Secreted protein n=1 Tax=Batillaria attramentaria TaxID=370345 RepID=A0ABD0J8U2_9CAEN